MGVLTSQASAQLLSLIRVSYFFGLTGWIVTRDRLAALRDLSEPTDPVRRICVRTLEMDDSRSHDHWEDEPMVEEHGGVRSSSEPDDPEDSLVSFRVRGIAGLDAWHFRVGDPDPLPSVPHGHWQNRPKPKLDPYLGWVYDGTSKVRRESRASIVQLWNDQKFRTFAAKAINLFIASNPHYGGWRVANPFRLPRRRQP